MGHTLLVMAGKGTPATALLVKQKVAHTLHSYQHDPRHESFGLEAVEALGLYAACVFKTLVADVDGTLTVGVVPVTGQLDLKALATSVGGKKARMADPAAAQRATGYVLGGISPLGHRSRLLVVIDSSAQNFEAVHCSAGRRGLEVELAPADLVRLTHAVVAPIAA
jgi:Cys-tRNA(Pro)/Cys-tRNA(Cys) deacylase